MPRRGLRSAPALLALALFPLEREIANRSASGLAIRLNAPALFPVLEGLFLLFLAALGLMLVQALARVSVPLDQVLGLPPRATAAREWLLGAATGWAVPLVTVLALLLTRSVQFGVWFGATPVLLALSTLAGLLAATLAVEITFRGLPFRWLRESIGPAWSSVLLSIAFALIVLPSARRSPPGLMVGVLLGLLLAVSWLRTHALWLSWGLGFAWSAVLGILFGMPVSGSTSLSSLVQANLDRAPAFLGGASGPEAASLTLLPLLVAFAVLMRSTRDYAWNYTHAAIVAGGYPMDVAPPPEHAAMEASAPPPPLVQILPQTPQERSQTSPPL